VIVADSDVLIDALRGREPSSARVLRGLADRTLATTAISAFELRSGSRTAEQQATIEALLGALAILPFDEPASKVAAACRRELEGKGSTIGMGDYLIAAICISRAATLLTRNRRHFERIPGLLLGEP
jgi:predicted nucleic acid-binding protein